MQDPALAVQAAQGYGGPSDLEPSARIDPPETLTHLAGDLGAVGMVVLGNGLADHAQGPGVKAPAAHPRRQQRTQFGVHLGLSSVSSMEPIGSCRGPLVQAFVQSG